MKGLMSTQREQFISDMVEDVFKIDTNKDDAISFEEWKCGALTNQTVRLFLDPFESAYMIKDNYLLKNAPLIPEEKCDHTKEIELLKKIKIKDQVIVSLEGVQYNAVLEDISPEGWHLVRFPDLEDKLDVICFSFNWLFLICVFFLKSG